jgi:hypothetical protein
MEVLNGAIPGSEIVQQAHFNQLTGAGRSERSCPKPRVKSIDNRYGRMPHFFRIEMPRAGYFQIRFCFKMSVEPS